MSAAPRTRLFSWMVAHGTVTYLLMAFSFVAFGALSLNLVSYTAANANYLLSYGWEALQDDGLAQFVELWLKVFLAIAAYLVFKLCEHALIERFAHQREARSSHPPTADGEHP